MLAVQAHAKSKPYRLEVIPEKSVQACSRWGQIWTVDVSDGVLCRHPTIPTQVYGSARRGHSIVSSVKMCRHRKQVSTRRRKLQ